MGLVGIYLELARIVPTRAMHAVSRSDSSPETPRDGVTTRPPKNILRHLNVDDVLHMYYLLTSPVLGSDVQIFAFFR